VSFPQSDVAARQRGGLEAGEIDLFAGDSSTADLTDGFTVTGRG
jgi:hypothetical protein